MANQRGLGLALVHPCVAFGSISSARPRVPIRLAKGVRCGDSFLTEERPRGLSEFRDGGVPFRFFCAAHCLEVSIRRTIGSYSGATITGSTSGASSFAPVLSTSVHPQSAARLLRRAGPLVSLDLPAPPADARRDLLVSLCD